MRSDGPLFTAHGLARNGLRVPHRGTGGAVLGVRAMLEDVSIDALQAALRGLSQRQQAVSDNIANVNTPYFRARRVEFEGSLRRTLSDGADPLSTTPSVVFTDDSAGLNENNVDVNAETLIGIKAQLAYELALRATGDRFTLLRTAVKGA